MKILGFNLTRSKPKTPAPASPPAEPRPRAVRPRGARMYAAAQSSRLTQDWSVTITSANAEILTSRIASTSRSRQQERDNPYVSRALRIFESNVVGHTGIGLQMKIRDDDDANDLIEQSWKRAGRMENCTVTRSLSRVAMLLMTIDAVVRDGGILFRKRRGFSNPFKFALEPIEIDRLDHFWTRPATGSNNEIQFGIEMDEFKAPVAYHILTRHPGDVFAGRQYPAFRERVPADEILAVWDVRTRAGQLVGMPRFSSSLQRLNHLDKYDEAELVAARVAACKGGFLQKKSSSDSYVGDAEDDAGNKLEEVEPGLIQELPLDYEFKEYDPKHPTDAYAAFTKAQLRAIASGLGISYVSLANDLEGVNYSSIRAGLLEDREEFKKLQVALVEQLMDPWFADWLPFAILSGQLALPIGKLPKFNQPCWQPRRWDWVDPLKDVQADIAAIGAGLKSRKQIVAENGDDIDEIDADNSEDKAVHPDGPNYTAAYQTAPPPDEVPDNTGGDK